MEVLDAAWDEEEEIVIPNNENIAGYVTEVRTVRGSIVDIQNEILTVDFGGNNEHFIALADHPDLKWEFMAGDYVSVILLNRVRLDNLFRGLARNSLFM